MSDHERLSKIMKEDWDRRIKHDFRFWMSDGYKSDAEMWASGERDLSILLDGLKDTASMHFLEIGCGVGRLLKSAIARFKKVTGIDVSSEAIEKAKGLIGDQENLSLVVSNGLDLNFLEDHSIDCVGVFAALCSVPTEIFARYLLEINRVLKKDGQFRLQVYLGDEQQVGREDTLHLRCYEEKKFCAAVEGAGFQIISINDLVLPVDVSFESVGISAKIVVLQKITQPSISYHQVSSILIPTGEVKGKSLDGDIEYWMTLNYAKALVENGDIDNAKKALEYAADVSKAVTIDVGDLLERIVSEVEKRERTMVSISNSENYFDLNADIIKKRFPKVLETLLRDTSSTSDVVVKESIDGAVCFYKDQALDHSEKPNSAGEQWAKRSLQEKRFSECGDIVVLGAGFGYHIEALMRLTTKPISIIEPTVEVFRKALEVRDLRELLSKIRALYIGDLSGEDVFSDTSELLIRPQSLAIHAEEIPKIKERFYGMRGMKSLHPTVMVLGPLQGGTLPILGYTARALISLNQRVREMDMSPFNAGYLALQNMLKDRARQQSMHGNYLEMLAQSVLESVTEKKIDILICMAQAPITGRVLTELRNRGVITVLWFMEDYLRFGYWKEMAKFYDYVFTIQDGECIDLIKKAGAGAVHYLPAACDPIIHTPLTLSQEEREEWGSPISFVGAGYHNRQQVFASFAEMPFKLWGTEWPGCRPFDRMLQKGGKRLTPEEYIKIFNSTDININLHSSAERDSVDPFGDFVNPRTFELASVGAFQLVDERSHLPSLFEVGKEIITFNNTKDLKEKIEYYLQRPDERKAIGARARDRAIRQHTYGHRIKDMLSTIYSSRFEHIKNRIDVNPWRKMLERAQKHPELHSRCKAAHERGEEANLDGLVVDILVGQGKLSETEQKLLFLHHVSKQIIRMKMEETGQ